LCLLDEPTSNLDEHGVEWYLNTLEKMPKNRTLIIASNLEREYGFCKHKIDINQYKK
ncbi:MAG: ABC transporter ATP-binding protein, partial [Chitinophagales bacterium]|nr:ABC transporter ATP-binding protein [Chitinophagales bacterium]